MSLEKAVEVDFDRVDPQGCSSEQLEVGSNRKASTRKGLGLRVRKTSGFMWVSHDHPGAVEHPGMAERRRKCRGAEGQAAQQ